VNQLLYISLESICPRIFINYGNAVLANSRTASGYNIMVTFNNPDRDNGNKRSEKSGKTLHYVLVLDKLFQLALLSNVRLLVFIFVYKQ